MRALSVTWLSVVCALATACTGGIDDGGGDDGGGGGGGSGGGSGSGSGSGVTAQLIEQWSGCMTLDNFNAAKMATAWGTLASSTTGQACSGCHGTGFEGFYADRNATAMYGAITSVPQFLLQYFLPDAANGKMMINTGVFTAVGTGQPGHESHPRFEPTNNAGMTALRAFYDATLAKQQAGTCDPPRLSI